MKRIFSILMLAVIAIGCSQASANSSYKKPDAPERKGWSSELPLYGDVESITAASYVLEDKFGEITRSKTEGKSIVYFNEAGDVTEHIKYNSDGTLFRKYIYKYDAAGNMTEEAVYYSEGSLDYKYIRKYDDKGNMT